MKLVLCIGAAVLMLASRLAEAQQPPPEEIFQEEDSEAAPDSTSTDACCPAIGELVKSHAKLDEALTAANKTLSEIAKSVKKEDKSANVDARIPWNIAFIKLSEKEKRAIGQFGFSLASDWTAQAEVSAALDNDTRQAAFLDPEGTPAFTAKGTIEWNSVNEQLRADIESKDPRVCTSFQGWLKDRNSSGDVSTACRCTNEDFLVFLKEKGERSICSPKPGAPADAFARPLVVTAWSLGFEVEASFDTQEVFVAADGDEVRRSKQKTTASGVFKGYPSRNLAVSARLGASFKNDLKTEKFQRCEVLPSNTPEISGKACTDSLLVTKNPPFQIRGLFELGVVFVPITKWEDSNPGLDLRGRLEDIGHDAPWLLRVSTTAFIAPIDDALISRYGVGLEYRKHLGGDDEVEVPLVPFLIVGGAI